MIIIHHSNNFVNRLLKKENIDTTLSADSIFNYILYEDIIKLLEQLIFSDYIGTLNVVSNLNIVLDNAVQIVGKKANFGNYKYFTPVISNDKLLSIVLLSIATDRSLTDNSNYPTLPSKDIDTNF